MGVAGRFWNFVKGLFWQGQRSLEQANPEAVYMQAIQKMKENYQNMHTAVGRLAASQLPSAACVRHPASGGSALFRRQIASLLVA